MRAGAGLLPASFSDWSLDFRVKRFLTGLGWNPPLRHHIWVGSFAPDEVSRLLLSNTPGDSLDELRHYWQECDSDDLVEKAQYLDLKLYMQDDILMKVDRASMACSLEVRSPYLDYRVVEFLASLPSWMKLRFMKRK
jgi:asparagine synthase (glutamine-hydrolysing)